MCIVFLLIFMVATYRYKQHRTHIKMFKTLRLVCGVNIGTQDITINPILIPDEMHLGTHLGMYSHADTNCVNKHAFFNQFCRE